MVLYAVTVFLSAFLLFQVEPIIAKIILPWFGGSAAVWSTCLLFFQLGLLLGYLYAHGLIRLLGAKWQTRLHLFLLVLSLAALPVLPSNTWKPTGSEDPAFRILLLLGATIGLPYFLLSATSPLLQAWYARERPGAMPYRLFALSNAGSMLALLSYPVLVEPILSTRHQAVGWSAAYAGLALLAAIVAVRLRPVDKENRATGPSAFVPTESRIHSERAPGHAGVVRQPTLATASLAAQEAEVYTQRILTPEVSQRADTAVLPPEHADPRFITEQRYDSLETTPAASEGNASWKLQLLWMLLSACSSALLLAVTNHLSQNVAAVPFLWILPLSLYLLSFIICFGNRRWYRRNIFLQFLGLALGSMAYALSPEFENSSIYLLIPLYSAGLFICCVVCHGELERLKPHPRDLTSFYLMISLGGAVGGLFVGLLAPHLFSGYFELPIAMAACAWLTLATLHRDPSGTFYASRWKPARFLRVGLCVFLTVYLGLQIRTQAQDARVMMRNFYGSLRVTETDPDLEHERRKLTNGTIQHGSQFLEANRRRLPTTYYGPKSGVGLAIQHTGHERNIRVGVVGLGVGTIAVYGRPGDYYTFYDINPLVIKLANSWFTFLKDSPAKVDIVRGDARLSLQRESPRHFDVLAVDAFTSDSIPVHLLTLEAFRLYFQHLNAQGILAVHISNRFLNLEPVVRGLAQKLGKPAVVIQSEKDEGSGVFLATWVLVTDNREFLNAPEVQMALTPTEDSGELQVWRDDYSNLFRILK